MFFSLPWQCRVHLTLRTCVVAKQRNQFFVHSRDCFNIGIKTGGTVFCLNCRVKIGVVFGELIVFENVNFVSNRLVFLYTSSTVADAVSINRSFTRINGIVRGTKNLMPSKLK